MSDRKAIILAVLLSMAVGALLDVTVRWIDDLNRVSVRLPDTNQPGTLDPILNHESVR